MSINIVAVLVAGVVAFVVGFLIHGPLFGKLWMKLADIHPTGKEKLSDMMPQMVKNLLANFLTAYVLLMFYNLAVSSPLLGVTHGVACAVAISFWAWLGFGATSASMEYIWMGRSLRHYMFNVLASLAVYISMGIVIGWMY